MPIRELSIIRSPLVTERSTLLKEKHNQYVFRVHPDASKGRIRQAVKNLFKVDVEKVRTANYQGKLRRLAAGRPQGRRPDWKKAIVTLKAGQSINLEQETAK